VIASNLAVSFAQAGLRTLLLDLDLHSGDCALVLGLAPRATMLDLVAGSAPIDAEALGRAVTRHVSGADVLAAPARPEEEELVAVERLRQLVETARAGYDALETLDLLELDLPDVRIVMNRAGADVGLDTADIEATLRREIAYALPSDRAVPLSVNRGRAVVSDDPKSRAARSLMGVSRSLVAAVGR
jgi:pilus assembly protein CpaE